MTNGDGGTIIGAGGVALGEGGAVAKKKVKIKKPTSTSTARVRRHRAREKAARTKRIATAAVISREDWLKLAGDVASRNAEVAERHDLPMGGEQIDLRALVPALIRFLLGNKERLIGDNQDRELRRERERLKIEQARLALEQAREEWLRREDVERMLVDMAGVLRRGMDLLQRRFGAEALGIMQELLADYSSACDNQYGVRAAADSDGASGEHSARRRGSSDAEPGGGGNDDRDHTDHL